MVAAFSEERDELIGVARCISDGVFVHLIPPEDGVAVLPQWRRKGIGRALLRRLAAAVRQRSSGPPAFAAFSTPPSQPFLRACGYKSDPRFRVMRWGGGGAGRRAADDRGGDSY